VFETLASGYGLVEGPRAVGDSVLFSDVIGGGVHRWSPAGVSLLVPKRRGIGGLVAHVSGGVVMSGRDLSLGNRVVLPAPEGVAGFNDIVTTDDGGVLAGALRFRAVLGEEPVPGEIWRLSPGGESSLWADGVIWPNGIGLSPAGDVVYLSDYQTGEVLAYNADGGGRRVFITVPEGQPDGLAVDAEGFVWVALGGAKAIGRFSPDGELERRLDVPAEFVSSVAFGDGTLLVATAGALLRTEIDVAGRPVPPATV
jgi:gluconolactonase